MASLVSAALAGSSIFTLSSALCAQAVTKQCSASVTYVMISIQTLTLGTAIVMLLICKHEQATTLMSPEQQQSALAQRGLAHQYTSNHKPHVNKH
eukprot:3568-Heterococcus_DN1.PRE.2